MVDKKYTILFRLRLPLKCSVVSVESHTHMTIKSDWLVGCFGLNGPLRQYFSLYRAVSQRDGERKEK